MSQPAQHPTSQYPQFEVIEFNQVRHFRGAEALRMRVIHGEGDEDHPWMSPADLRKNMQQFGPLEALLAGQELYRRGGNASSRGDLE
ncbi:hypothetical protein EVC62_02310 [Salinicola endophyticus]|uniref:NUDIX hydrolase n=1 Tax=Salinicola endophyticus TaxID=1949083 RepID=A0ABY8FEL2_9GAMM|nr:hypothetical protein [Salinicola endophyticus]WFF40425.1 hypothetical protein EVC62_02310 [Salinicola endophyticus]